jgi:hypothetical protein
MPMSELRQLMTDSPAVSWFLSPDSFPVGYFFNPEGFRPMN